MKNKLKNKMGTYTAIPNDLIRNPEISGLAKAVFCYLASRPDDWEFFTSEVIKNFKEGRDAIRTAIDVLCQHGYLTKTQERRQGQFAKNVYNIHFTPFTENPSTANPSTAKPTLTKTDNTKTDSNKKNKQKKGERLPYENLPVEWEPFCYVEMNWTIEQAHSAFQSFYDHYNSPDCKNPLRKDWPTTFKNSCRRGFSRPNVNLTRGNNNDRSNNKSIESIANALARA